MEAPYDRWYRLAHASDFDSPEFKILCLLKYVTDKSNLDPFTAISFCLMQSDIHQDEKEYTDILHREMDYAIKWKREAVRNSIDLKVSMQ